jgi:hypothetical protein
MEENLLAACKSNEKAEAVKTIRKSRQNHQSKIWQHGINAAH